LLILEKKNNWFIIILLINEHSLIVEPLYNIISPGLNPGVHLVHQYLSKDIGGPTRAAKNEKKFII